MKAYMPQQEKIPAVEYIEKNLKHFSRIPFILTYLCKKISNMETKISKKESKISILMTILVAQACNWQPWY